MKKKNTPWQQEIIPFIGYMLLFLLVFKLSYLSLPPIPYMEVRYSKTERPDYKSSDHQHLETKEIPEFKPKITESSNDEINTKPIMSTDAFIAPTRETAHQKVHVDTVNEALLIRSGLPRYIARNWMKYTQKGGAIRTKADAMKLYGMTDSIFQVFSPNIIFVASRKAIEPKTIEVNSAKEGDWQQLRGIGGVLSKRIIKFRDRLGGFARIDQVKETYGITDSLFLTIQPYLKLEQYVEKLNINLVGEERMASHPYVNYHQAKVIAKYRDNHSKFTRLEDLLATQVVDTLWLKKMKPYLTFEENTAL